MLSLPGAGRALLLCSDDASGVEPWRTDGTTAGTVLHQDIAPGPDSSIVYPAARLAGAGLYFAAYDGVTGSEPWTLRSFAAAIPFGAGCAGSGGSVPGIAARGGPPAIGNAGFGLELRGGRPDAVAVLVLANGAFADEPDLPCLIRVEGPLAILALRLDAAGAGAVPLPVPPSPGLAGSVLFAQCGVFDPEGLFPGGVALSGGLQLIVSEN
jgi:ELWxxDGT repeat protein